MGMYVVNVCKRPLLSPSWQAATCCQLLVVSKRLLDDKGCLGDQLLPFYHAWKGANGDPVCASGVIAGNGLGGGRGAVAKQVDEDVVVLDFVCSHALPCCCLVAGCLVKLAVVDAREDSICGGEDGVLRQQDLVVQR